MEKREKGVGQKTPRKKRQDFEDWFNKEEKICFYCKRNWDEILAENDRVNKKTKRFSVDRADNKKGYETGNIVLSCMRCNAIKNNYFTKDEMLKIGKIIYDKNS